MRWSPDGKPKPAASGMPPAQAAPPAPRPAARGAPAAAAPAPAWAGQRLPGDRVADVAAAPGLVFGALLELFSQGVPAIATEHAWEISAIAFVSYVAVDIQVAIWADTRSEAGTVLVFRHTSHRDVVRFQQLCSSAMDYLLPRTSQDGGPLAACRADTLLPAEDLEDVLFDELEVDWPLRVTSAFQAIASPLATSREEGLQMLASWAACRPESRVAIAEEVAAQAGLLQALWHQASPAELYPLCVVLRFATLHATPLLAGQVLRILPTQTSGLSSIIVTEIDETFKNVAGWTENDDGSEEHDQTILSGVTPEKGSMKSLAAPCALPCRRIAGTPTRLVLDPSSGGAGSGDAPTMPPSI